MEICGLLISWDIVSDPNAFHCDWISASAHHSRGVYTLALLFVFPVIFCPFVWVSMDMYQVLSEGERLKHQDVQAFATLGCNLELVIIARGHLMHHVLSDLDMLETGEKRIWLMYLGQRSANSSPWAKSNPLPVFVNKVDQNSTCLFFCVYVVYSWFLYTQLNWIDLMAHKPYNTHFLALYRRALPI